MRYATGRFAVVLRYPGEFTWYALERRQPDNPLSLYSLPSHPDMPVQVEYWDGMAEAEAFVANLENFPEGTEVRVVPEVLDSPEPEDYR